MIIDAVEALPADRVDPETIAEAEAQLIADARDHDAKALRVLGRRILDVVAPRSAKPTKPPSWKQRSARPPWPPG